MLNSQRARSPDERVQLFFLYMTIGLPVKYITWNDQEPIRSNFTSSGSRTVVLTSKSRALTIGF